MATEGAPPEFKLALDSTAVPHGPDGIGESPFDFTAAPEAMEYPSELGDKPLLGWMPLRPPFFDFDDTVSESMLIRII